MAVGSDYAARLREAGVYYKALTVMRGRAKVIVFTAPGVDLTNYDFAGEVRVLPDAGGDPVASWTFEAVLTGGDTVITATLSAGAIDGPTAPEPGAAAQLYYDLTMTPLGGAEKVFMGGEIYRAGSVTA